MANDGFIRSGGNGFLTDKPQKENSKEWGRDK